MFTGLIEEVATIEAVRPASDILRVKIASQIVRTDLQTGDSVSVDGVCLTVTALEPGSFWVDMVPETRQRTTFREVRPGRAVNLERALRLGDRLGGHFVQGHVDGIAQIIRLDRVDQGYWLEVVLPEGTDRFVVEKGSIALDGISLTVARKKDSKVAVAVIPHTWQHTALHTKSVDDFVNVEADLLAKYIATLLGRSGEENPEITEDWLREHGFA